jgi:hypothetical protein
MTVRTDPALSILEVAPPDLRRLIGFLRRGGSAEGPPMRDAVDRVRGIVRGALERAGNDSGDTWDRALYKRLLTALGDAGHLFDDAMAYAFVSFVEERAAPHSEERERELEFIARYFTLDVTWPGIESPDTKHLSRER